MPNEIENHSLTRKISIVIAVKLALLFVLWKVCFSHPMPSIERQEGIHAIFLVEDLNDK